MRIVLQITGDQVHAFEQMIKEYYLGQTGLCLFAHSQSPFQAGFCFVSTQSSLKKIIQSKSNTEAIRFAIDTLGSLLPFSMLE